MSVLSQRRSMPQLARKIYHFGMGLLCFALYAFALTRTQALWLLATIGGVWVLFDYIRLRSVAVNRVALRIFGPVMRREELTSITGNSFYILGLLTLVALFPKNIVLYSVLFLAIGDPSAAIVGTLFGRRKLFGKKSLEGALANFTLSFIAAALLTHFYFSGDWVATVAVGLAGGAASTIAELCPLPIDDNFTIPVGSAALLWLFLTAFPLISF